MYSGALSLGQSTVQMADTAAGVHKDIPQSLRSEKQKKEVRRPEALTVWGNLIRGRPREGISKLSDHICLTSE